MHFLIRLRPWALGIVVFMVRVHTLKAESIFSTGVATLASWISHNKINADEAGVFHFRKTFNLAENPSSFLVHVSADKQYRLYVNGKHVSSGPQRSDPMHWRYEPIDLAPHLREGKNALSAVVWDWGRFRPLAQHSLRTAFLVKGKSEKESIVDTGNSWKVLHNKAYEFHHVSYEQVDGYYAAAPSESVDGGRYPWGWKETGYDDAHWSLAQVVPIPPMGRSNDPYGAAGGWQLVPRTLPQMEEKPIRFEEVRRAEGVEANSGFLKGTGL